MKKRFLALLMVAVFAVAMVPTVSAQEDDGCFGLNPDDCAVIQTAYANLDSVTSFNQTFSIDVSVTGLEAIAGGAPDVPEALTFSVTGSGPFALLGEGDVPVAMSLPMVVNASGLFPEPLVDVAVPFVITEGVLYTLGDGEVIGIPLDAELLGELGGDALGGLGLPLDPADALGGLGEAGAPADLGALFGDMGGMGDLSAYTSYLRDGDVFTFNLDVAALLNSPEIQQALTAAGGLAGDDPNLQMGLALLPALLAGVQSDMVVTQTVDPELNIVDEVTFSLDFAIDLAMLLGSGSTEGEAPPPIEISLDFAVAIDQINGDFTYPVPEGARVLTPEELEEMGGGLGLPGGGA